MKKIVFIFISIFMVVSVFGQTQFQELTFEKALEKAKAEKKYVFVDCYTSWCGPCKMMADKILPLKEVGDYLNAKFVCLKIDMEKGEGVEIARKYRVDTYPTFLILKEDGGLLHRVVGGTASGEEFVKKIEAVFDEGSAFALESEYNAGNRKMDFLLKYIKALMVSENVEKARSIALDVITALEDGQKCTDPYWFIYESYHLSPVGSGNLAYFTKHVEQFRKGVGVEKVDKKLGAMFALQYETILRGANKNVTLEEAKHLRKTLDSYKLSGQDYLYGYADLVEAIMEGDTEKALAGYKAAFPSLSDEKIAVLYFSPILYFKDKWNARQKKELLALTDQLIERAKMPQLKNALKNFKASVFEK